MAAGEGKSEHAAPGARNALQVEWRSKTQEEWSVLGSEKQCGYGKPAGLRRIFINRQLANGSQEYELKIKLSSYIKHGRPTLK